MLYFQLFSYIFNYFRLFSYIFHMFHIFPNQQGFENFATHRHSCAFGHDILHIYQPKSKICWSPGNGIASIQRDSKERPASQLCIDGKNQQQPATLCFSIQQTPCWPLSWWQPHHRKPLLAARRHWPWLHSEGFFPPGEVAPVNQLPQLPAADLTSNHLTNIHKPSQTISNPYCYDVRSPGCCSSRAAEVWSKHRKQIWHCPLAWQWNARNIAQAQFCWVLVLALLDLEIPGDMTYLQDHPPNIHQPLQFQCHGGAKSVQVWQPKLIRQTLREIALTNIVEETVPSERFHRPHSNLQRLFPRTSRNVSMAQHFGKVWIETFEINRFSVHYTRFSKILKKYITVYIYDIIWYYMIIYDYKCIYGT